MKAMNIKWDTDGDEELAKELPDTIEIPEELANEAKDLNDENEAISDYLSDVTGFCHYGLDLVID